MLIVIVMPSDAGATVVAAILRTASRRRDGWFSGVIVADTRSVVASGLMPGRLVQMRVGR